ncbi:PTPRJ [Lepeophtheirus salmonis]|nr:PTPRJ [Lepeophtheirus salmonis]
MVFTVSRVFLCSQKEVCTNDGPPSSKELKKWRLYKLDNSDGSTDPAGSDDIEMRYFNDIDIKRGISDCQNYTLEVELIHFQGKKGTGDWFQIKKVNTTSLPDHLNPLEETETALSLTTNFQCSNLDPIFIQSTPNHHYEVMNLVPNTDYYHCHTEFIYRVQNISSYSYGKMEKFATSKVEYQVSDITSTSVTINLDEGIIDYLNYHLSYLCVSQWDKKRVISLNDQVTKIIDLMPYRKYKFCLQVTPIQQDDQQRSESCYYRMTQEDRPSTPPVVKSVKRLQYDMTIYSRCKYDYSSFCKMESCSNWTNANDSGDEVKSFSSDTNEYNFFRLSPYTEYQVNISAYTSAGQGPWSQQEIVIEKRENISDIFGNCKIPEPICKTGRTLEDIPDDPPRVYNSRQTLDLTKNSFKVIWQPPKEPNGIITNYQLEMQIAFILFFPHWIYEVRIRAINSIGPSDWSLWEHCQIKTLSTVLLDEYNFTTASTSSEISMVVLPYCPFTGPLKYTVKFNEAGKNTLTEYFEYTPPFMSELSSSFNAKPGKNYTICLSVEVKIDDFVKCKTDCSSIKSICKNVAATCSNIPQTTETPIQIEDQSDYSCNPFTNAVINIEKMTFDGSGNIWDLDTIIIIENLLYNSTITLIVEAIGCNNTVFTPKFKIRTQSIQIPTVEQIIEEELESLKGSKEGNALVEKMNLVKNSGIFLIRENKINIQYGEVEYYTIGNTTWSSNRLFKINKFNNELRPGEDCYKPVIDKDGISCYIGASIQGDNVNDISDEIAVHVQSNISGELQNYSSIIKIKRDFIDYSTVISVLVTLLSIGFVVILVVVGLRFKNNFIGISKKRNTAATSSMVRLNKGPSHSIQISEFVKKLEERKIDFKEEFQELDKCETLMITLNKTTDQAILNNELNRYANILPYDDSPGSLRWASWVHKCKLDKNTNKQWVRIIVVLTKLVEKTINVEDKSINSVIKCEQYWPKQGKKTYGVFTVELIEEHGSPNLPQLIERRLKVTNTETRSSHTVLQLQYIGWPDHGAPTSPKKTSCPPFIGRTGTLLALDSISKEIDEGNTEIDVMKTVFELRMNRCKMVQQSIQYKYLYYCIGAYIKENVHTVRDPSTYQDEIEVQYMYPGN